MGGRTSTAVIVAAGSGKRLGAGGPKALVEVAGRPLFEHSLEAFRAAEAVEALVVVAPPGHEAAFEREGVLVVAGGAERHDSVRAGLEAVETELVAVHDAARPLITPGAIDGAVRELAGREELHCVTVAAPVADTIKRVDRGGRVVETLDRDELRAIQTPQVSRTEALRAAFRSVPPDGITDDAALIERNGGTVATYLPRCENLKVTTPQDLAAAESILLSRQPPGP